MAKKKPFFAACLAAWKPEVDDSIFYGCSAADNHDLYGDSIEDLASQYAGISLGEDKIKRRASIVHEGKYLGWIDDDGVTMFSSPLNMPEYIRKMKEMALENAKRLKASTDILSQIENGNFHEVYFFSDPRCLRWCSPDSETATECGILDSAVKNIEKALDVVYSVVEAATRNGKQMVMEGQLCLF